ncbi:MAG: cobaltochelatase subunit CobN [Rhizobiaceae bacterium]
MHLLLAQRGAINEGDEAVDLGQNPGDIVFLSAADTELASLAAANGEFDQDCPTLRLANLQQLSHPMSVDTYLERTISCAKLVVVRLLGGKGYWSYGLDSLFALARRKEIHLVVLPGDDKPDPILAEHCTLGATHQAQLHAYLLEGGPVNAANFLRYCHHLLGRTEAPAEPAPLIKAGIWYPGQGICSPEDASAQWQEGRPIAAICFYRALVQSGGLQPISVLVGSLEKRGLNPLPVFISSLKDPVSVETLRGIFGDASPEIVINLTGFAVSSPARGHSGTVLDENGAIVLQAVLAGGSQEAWEDSSQGLSSRDLAMNVALPEIDGRVLSRAIAFKHAGQYDEAVQANIVQHKPHEERVGFVSDLAANWVRLRRREVGDRRVAIILANYPNRDGRIGNGVGLDTPAGTIKLLHALEEAGYRIDNIPPDGDALIGQLLDGPTNAVSVERKSDQTLNLDDYLQFFRGLPVEVQNQIQERWGDAKDDQFFDGGLNSFNLPVIRNGNIVVGIQPARGYNIDPKQSYHSPDLVPPHGYLAFYCWLRNGFGVDVIVNMGKHGNLEWLPGKALALSENCYPDAVLGPVPNLYPFIVNDPGEGTQAKRRTSSVIIDHLTPPLTRAESYGALRDLEALVDEYYEASGNDPRRLKLLGRQIFDLISDIGLDEDAGIADSDSEDEKLTKVDAYLCELKEMQIRDGLHVFGEAPQGRLLHDLATALVRVPRGLGQDEDDSLQRAIADDLHLEFDPLDCEMSDPWKLAQPEALVSVTDDPWRTKGDAVERIELLASALISGDRNLPDGWQATGRVLEHVQNEIIPTLETCGEWELAGILRGMDGRFVAPGPSGAPTRGRLDVLPTGRNFFSVDSRSVPTPAAWELGKKSAELLITRFRQDEGDWPNSFGLSAWGTSNMRTGGDDIAQALALIGARPVWEHASRRVTGYEIVTLAELGRPRVDVTLRISGFFRDAFPSQIELFDKAIRAIGALDEDVRDNPIAERMRTETAQLVADGVDENIASKRAGYRVFGSKPGAYGAGLQALIDEKGWEDSGDLAEAYLAWGGYAYGANEEGKPERDGFSRRLQDVEAVIHNQDNREHDLLDSDDYYQFEGGMTAAVHHLSGTRPRNYHNDHSRPERPVIRALDEEIARVVRGRAANPKWIAGVMRHGYKGAFEMAATLDYLFAFSATTGAVRDHHFSLVHDAWLADPEVLDFLKEHNPHALKEMADRFLEAQERGLWTARSNSAKFELETLANT